MLIDTHCHLTFDDLAPQVDAVLERARAAGVRRVITVSTTVADARKSLELTASRPAVFLAAGIHPHEAAKTTPDDLAALADLHRGRWSNSAATGRLVAIGETGLDFHYDFATPEQQEAVFRHHIELARETGRPLVIHAREAEQRVCDILSEYPELAERVAFHCFSGDPELARRVLDLGFLLSFTGVVTFKNAGAIRESARLAPADRILIETDAPFLTPEPIRQQRPCEPAFVVHTARFLANLRAEPFEVLAAATTANAERFFKLPVEQP
jgi:TatD DNase family protein